MKVAPLVLIVCLSVPALAGARYSQSLKLPWDVKPGTGAWTPVLVEALSASKLPDREPAGITDFVPTYPVMSRAQRIEAWANLIVIISKYESDWDPHSVYREPPPLGIDSIGLLQLSYQDEGPYKLPVHLSRKTKDLEDPLINLRCTVAIMEQLLPPDAPFVGKDAKGKWAGLCKYWSVTRSTRRARDKDGNWVEVPRKQFESIRDFMRGLKL